MVPIVGRSEAALGGTSEIAHERIQALGESGTCVIEIDNDSSRVVASDCPQQICMTMGAVSQFGQWIACFPYGVFIDLEGADAVESTVDGVAW